MNEIRELKRFFQKYLKIETSKELKRSEFIIKNTLSFNGFKWRNLRLSLKNPHPAYLLTPSSASSALSPLTPSPLSAHSDNRKR